MLHVSPCSLASRLHTIQAELTGLNGARGRRRPDPVTSPGLVTLAHGQEEDEEADEENDPRP